MNDHSTQPHGRLRERLRDATAAAILDAAEAVFAEIHAYHPEVVDYAQSRHVWIVSPTTTPPTRL